MEGSANSATGQQAHVEGNNNSASGNNAHVEGVNNRAVGACSHVGGRDNEAGYSYQTVIGKYNKNASDSLFEVGNGTGTALANRSNAIAVKEDGRILKGAADAFPAASNLAPVEMTRTMSTQRTAGSYVYVAADDTTYKITTTIAASGTLTPGTNATAVNVGDELSSISSDLANKGTFAHKGIYAGYVTASKNYINFFVPMDLAHGASNPSVNVAITSLSAYIGTSRLSFAGYFDTSYISVNAYKYGITVEIKFLSTYSVEAPVSVYADLNITVS